MDALLDRPVCGPSRGDWAAAYADVTRDDLLVAIHAATTEQEVERCEYLALLLLGPASTSRELVAGLDGHTATVELHLWRARSRLGCLRSDPTVAASEAMQAELADRRRIGVKRGTERRAERTQRVRERTT